MPFVLVIDDDALDLLHDLRHARRAHLVMTEFASVHSAVQAIRLGARDYIETPVPVEQMAGAATPSSGCAAPDRTLADLAGSMKHAASRWARVVSRIVHSPQDLKTLDSWARWVATSPGAIRNWCRTANVATKSSLDMGRMLRAVERHQREGTSFEDLLDVVDHRTLSRLLTLGTQKKSRTRDLPSTVDELLVQQQWVRNESALAELRTALKIQPATLSGSANGHRPVAEGRFEDRRRPGEETPRGEPRYGPPRGMPDLGSCPRKAI